MDNIKDFNNKEEEIIIAKKHTININLIEILVGDRKGTYSEHKLLEQLKKELGDKFYIEVLYFLTHTMAESGKEAKKTYNKILTHRNKINKKLNRNLGIQIAVLDYMKNLTNILKNPTIIEERNITNIAKSGLKDELTKTFDKKLLFHDLNREINQIKRYGTKFSILMLDLDNLKNINDKYGHSSGDKVLILLSDTLKNNIRNADTLYRFGGDEFIILLPKAAQPVAKKVADKLINSVRKTSLKNKNIEISASIGIESFNRNNIKDADGVIDTADKALYKAKKSGKNRINILQEYTSFKIEKKAKKEKYDKIKISKELGFERFEATGTVISPGIAVGKVFIYRDILSRNIDLRELTQEELSGELSRIKNALKLVEKDIIATRDKVTEVMDKEYGDIFDAHRLLLIDPQVTKELRTELYNERINAEHVVKNVFKRFENRFKISENHIIRERADDIADLSRRLLRTLTGMGKNILSKAPSNSVIVANRLLPSDTVNLSINNVNAIITAKGSKSSHAALLARSLNIPYITELDFPANQIKPNSKIIIDTDRKKAILNPGKNETKKYLELIKERNIRKSDMLSKIKKITLTTGSKKIKILANAASEDEIRQAMMFGCDGIGLYRIEQLYMKHNLPLDETELLKGLKSAFDNLGRTEITVRLLDIGGDKSLPYLNSDEEQDSFLGLRGVRVLLKNPKILHTQLKVIAELSKDFNVKILVPMVTIPDEIKHIRKVLNEITNQSGIKKKIKLGSMIETPAAVIKIKEILQVSDFISIGTNDLIQYTMVAGRENVSVANYYEAGSEIVMTFIKKVIVEAHKEKKECVLCGELASNTNYTDRLLRLGLENFSVSVPSIPYIKNKIAELLKLV